MRRHDTEHEATLLVSVIVTVVVYSILVMTHAVVLPSGGPLVDTLNLIASLRSPAIAAILLHSSLLSVTSLFWSLTEFLREWEPWSSWLLDLLSALLLLAVRSLLRRATLHFEGDIISLR